MNGNVNIGFQLDESGETADKNGNNNKNNFPVTLDLNTSVIHKQDGQSNDEKRDNIESKQLQNDLENSNFIARTLIVSKKATTEFMNKNKGGFSILGIIILHTVLIGYFAYATYYYRHHVMYSGDIDWCSGYGLLVLIYIFMYFLIFYYKIVKKYFANFLTNYFIKPLKIVHNGLFKIRFMAGIFWTAFFTACIIFLVFDSRGNYQRLIPLIGLILFIVFGFVFSKHPGHIKWRTVLMGLALQFIFGVITIRWPTGRNALKCFGDKVSGLLNMTSSGASMVYGDMLALGTESIPAVFAFSVLPVIYFVSFFISILYYYGIMQSVVSKMGWALGSIMGTTICESVNSAANIFLGMTESLILLRPYLDFLTKSELHSIMASGFATVSGSVLAAYISFGAEPAHLITASVMSAPAALCFTKLYYPEVEESKSASGNIKLEESTDSSVLDAASKGASAGTEVVLGIIANLIGFISFVALLNAVVFWLGYLVYEEGNITFEWIVGQIFMPISWTMGVPWEECEKMGTLIGLKTVINEFVAYERFSIYKKQNLLSPRGQTIATYALCGFSNPGSIGIMIGTLSTMLPKKRSMLTGLAVRAFISGTIVCFMTACVAAMLIDDDSIIKISNPEITTRTL